MLGLIDEFSQLALRYSNKRIDQVYNYYINTKNEEEAAWITEHFMLFIKAGEAARKTPAAVKRMIMTQKDIQKQQSY